MSSDDNLFRFIGNRKERNHESLVNTLLEHADEAILVSPYLFPDFSWWIQSLSFVNLERLTLVTTLAPRGDDQLNKPRSLLSLHEALQDVAPHVDLVIQIDNALHGKVYLFSSAGTITDGLVTSANLTRTGLRQNHEWGIHITDRPMLASIWSEISASVEYPYISTDLLRKMELFADTYIRNNKDFKPAVDVDAWLLNALQNAPRLSGLAQEIDWTEVRRIFFKPIGTKDAPVLKEDRRPFDDIRGDLDFPKIKPADVGIRDVVICFGTGSRCVVSVNRVLSNPEERPQELQARDEHASRWPWFVHGQNLTPKFGARWYDHDLTIDRLADDFKQDFPGLPITAQGTTTLGAFNFGAGRLRLSLEFGRFVADRIFAIENLGTQPTTGATPQTETDAAHLESRFHESMLGLYDRALEEAGYKATKFRGMVLSMGGLETARLLIDASNVSDGYTKLWEKRRLDLTVEAFVLSSPEFHPLFTRPQLERCRKRLVDYDFDAESMTDRSN